VVYMLGILRQSRCRMTQNRICADQSTASRVLIARRAFNPVRRMVVLLNGPSQRHLQILEDIDSGVYCC